jgi:alpha-L-rhamnosidase
LPTTHDQLAQLREKFLSPRSKSRPTPIYWWSGSDLNIERMIWHLDMLAEKDVGGTIICYAHRPDGSVDHASPEPFSEDWWQLLREFTEASAERGLSVGLCDYQIIGLVLLRAGAETTGLGSGSLRNTGETVSGPGSFIRPLDEGEVLTRRAISSDGEKIIDAAKLIQNEIVWTVPEGQWILSTTSIAPGKIYLSKSDFDPLHPQAGRLVLELFYEKFKQELGAHIGTTFTTFFQDELELGLTTPMWNSLVGKSIEDQGFDTHDSLHLLWHGANDRAMEFRGLYRDSVVNLLQENFFKPIFEWHENNGTDLVMDQLSRGDLALGHEHYADFMETMAWYQGPGNDDPDLTGPRNIAAFRTSSSIAHQNGRHLVTNEAFHSSGWGVTPHMMLSGLNVDFAAGANQVVLHGLDYTLESGWWEWASPDFHFRQPWWEHSAPIWTYLSRVSEIMQSGTSATEIAILDPTPELDFFSDSEAPAYASKLIEELSLRGLGIDLVPQAYLGNSRVDENSGVAWISARLADYAVVIVPNLKVIRSKALDALSEFVSAGGIVIAIESFPIRTDHRLLTPHDFEKWTLVSSTSELASHLNATYEVDFKISSKSPSLLQSHRKFGECDIYFLANPGDNTREFQMTIRGHGELEIWDAWTGASAALESEASTSKIGPRTRELKLSLSGGGSAILIGSSNIVPSKRSEVAGIIDEIDISGGWSFQAVSNLDNRYFDYSNQNQILPIASYHIDIAESSHGTWRTGLVDHGVRFMVAGPIASSVVDSFESELLSGDSLGHNAKAASWRGYELSFHSGIPQDAYLQDRMTGPHGLKGVPDEFLDPQALDEYPAPGSHYYFWSTVESDGETTTLRTTGRANHKVWVNSELKVQREETPAGHFPPWNLRDMSSEVSETEIRLQPGTNHVLTRVTVSAGQPSRVAAVIGGSPPERPSLAKMKWWQGVTPAKQFIAPITRSAGWYSVQIPPGAKSAFIPTTAVIHCGDEATVNAVVGGYEILISSECGRLTFKLTEDENPTFDLDAGGLSGPITWHCEPGAIDVAHWPQIGLGDFSGLGIYEREIELGPEKPSFASLVFSKLEGSARVIVNDSEVGVCFEPDAEIRIDKYLAEGKNKVVIESANTLVNLFSRLPSPYSIMQKPGGGFEKIILKVSA